MDTINQRSQEATALDVELCNLVAARLPHDEHSLRQYQRGLEYYRKRLEAINFRGDILLDVGCGAGNWSLAASPLFRFVVGVDVNERRLRTAISAARLANIGNVKFVKASAGYLPIPDSKISHCICVNAFQYFSKDVQLQAFKEFRRIVEPRGRIYFTVTRFGYLVYLLVQAIQEPGRRTLWSAMKAIGWNLAYVMKVRATPEVIIDERQFLTLATRHGWDLVFHGPEGASANGLVSSLYPSHFLGIPFMWEYMLQ